MLANDYSIIGLLLLKIPSTNKKIRGGENDKLSL
jgi:hypothetical protein